MRILVIHDNIDIFVWRVGESAADAEAHIRNGYPDLLPAWQAGSLTAVEIDVPPGDEYRGDLYHVVDNGNGPVVERRQP